MNTVMCPSSVRVAYSSRFVDYDLSRLVGCCSRGIRGIVGGSSIACPPDCDSANMTLVAMSPTPPPFSRFPNVSTKGRGYQIRAMANGVEGWEELRKVSVWQTAAALQLEMEAKMIKARISGRNKNSPRKNSLPSTYAQGVHIRPLASPNEGCVLLLTAHQAVVVVNSEKKDKFVRRTTSYDNQPPLLQHRRFTILFP